MRLDHTHTWSGKGERPEQFLVRLTSITVDAEDRLLAIGDREVKRFAADGGLETRFPTRKVGWSVNTDGEWIWAGMRGTLERYNQAGKWQGSIEHPNPMGRITGLAVRDGTVIAADATHRALHLHRDGKWQREVGRDANTRGFMIPNGVLDLALEAEGGSFIVAHSQKHRVERYSLEGAFMDKFGRFGMHDPADFGGCCNPTNIAALKDGLIAVSEKAPPCVKIYGPDGTFLARSRDGAFDPNTKNINLASDSRDRLYATDPLRCTVEVFQLRTADRRGAL